VAGILAWALPRALEDGGGKAVGTGITVGMLVGLLLLIAGVRVADRHIGFRLKLLVFVCLGVAAFCLVGYLSTAGQCDIHESLEEIEACEIEKAQTADEPLSIGAGFIVAGLLCGARAHRALRDTAKDWSLYGAIGGLVLFGVILSGFLVAVSVNETWSGRPVSAGAWRTRYGVMALIGLAFGVLWPSGRTRRGGNVSHRPE
jgi:hypothetical protein